MILYVVYAYSRIRISQKADSVKVIKGEENGYHLQLYNEGFISLDCIQLSFYENTVEMKENTEGWRYTLLPKSRVHYDTPFICLYSGTYYAGVSQIHIWDYFHLFCYTFPMPEKLKFIVKPAITEWDDGENANRGTDEKNEPYMGNGKRTKAEPQVRPYQYGDEPAMIHWKNSARVGELMVRQRESEELPKTVLIMDARLDCEGELDRLILVDKLLEVNIALVHFYYRNQIATQIILGSKAAYNVETAKEFEQYYEEMAEFEFEDKKAVELLEQFFDKEEGEYRMILLTVDAGEEVFDTYLKRKEQIKQMSIYNVVYKEKRLGERSFTGNCEVVDLPLLGK